MLETVRSQIQREKSDETDYNTFFLLYVIEVQDSLIEQEFSYMLKHNVIDAKFIDREFTSAVKELKEFI